MIRRPYASTCLPKHWNVFTAKKLLQGSGLLAFDTNNQSLQSFEEISKSCRLTNGEQQLQYQATAGPSVIYPYNKQVSCQGVIMDSVQFNLLSFIFQNELIFLKKTG